MTDEQPKPEPDDEDKPEEEPRPVPRRPRPGHRPNVDGIDWPHVPRQR